MANKKAKPKGQQRAKNDGYASQARMTTMLDELSAFEEFKKEILPALREDLTSGMEAADLYKKYQAHAAARGITIALTSTNERNAINIIKDIQDRAGGKAVERKVTEHRFADLPEEELDSIVLSEWQRAEDDDIYN